MTNNNNYYSEIYFGQKCLLLFFKLCFDEMYWLNGARLIHLIHGHLDYANESIFSESNPLDSSDEDDMINTGICCFLEGMLLFSVCDVCVIA